MISAATLDLIREWMPELLTAALQTAQYDFARIILLAEILLEIPLNVFTF